MTGATHPGPVSPRMILWSALRPAATLFLTLLGLLLATFIIGHVLPVDPVLTAIGDRAGGEAYERARTALGFDRPLYIQFLLYAGRVLHGDFGRSILTSNPVIADIAHFFPATFELATLAILIGAGSGIPLGVKAAANRGGWGDRAVRLIGLFGYSVPVFWLGLVGLFIFYAELGWAAGPGRLDIVHEEIIVPITGLLLIDSLLEAQLGIFLDALRHILLPAAILGLFSFATISRMTRNLMIEQLSQEYIVTARMKGLSEARILWRHAFGNVLAPLITVIALAYAGLLEGSVLTETIFAWPGIGAYMTNSLLNADMNAILGVTMVVGAVFVLLNLLADIAAGLVDPRIR